MQNNGEVAFVQVKNGSVFVSEIPNGKAFKITHINMLEGDGQDTTLETCAGNEIGSGGNRTKPGSSTKSVSEETGKNNKRPMDQRSPESDM